MARSSASEAFIPSTRSLLTLAKAVQKCHGCDLYQHATQAVFGEGPLDARLFLVGEVPGDAEDLAGRPFVGPAGRLLDEALEIAGLDRGAIYITNAVKHFKFERRGKKRLHQKPNQGEISACRSWLDAELRIVHPEVIVCLGATAAQAFLGSTFRITQHRGEILESTPFARYWMATYHPSALLRMPDEAGRMEARRLFALDLAQIPRLLSSEGPSLRP